ncbi:hypothetical protein MPL3365_290043 [Mesorhizobium plurifarium]|uniref:Uncharacterized protein n=1 Tax=Mesorhizobium plurifarium TaxID=69974 RepID=A0A090GDB9_MESPL|nr:hypothetical protein MPL3365_290043 [Mesorhizobium plurifarium]
MAADRAHRMHQPMARQNLPAPVARRVLFWGDTWQAQLAVAAGDRKRKPSTSQHQLQSVRCTDERGRSHLRGTLSRGGQEGGLAPTFHLDLQERPTFDKPVGRSTDLTFCAIMSSYQLRLAPCHAFEVPFTVGPWLLIGPGLSPS